MIPFTQYLRPDGRRRQIEIAMPDDVEALAQDCIAHGVQFEAEVLRDDITVSFTAVLHGQDIGIQIAPNFPGSTEAAVENLVRDVHKHIAFAAVSEKEKESEHV